MGRQVMTEEAYLLTNLQLIRRDRAWIESEFLLYEKLIEHRLELLDDLIVQVRLHKRKIRKEAREASSRANRKII
jgi:hypothetical protein